MTSPTEIITVEPAASRTSSQRFFNICYLTAISVATLGWLSAVGWMTFMIAKLVLA